MKFKVEHVESGLFAVMQYTSDDRWIKKICECHQEEYANIIADLFRYNNVV